MQCPDIDALEMMATGRLAGEARPALLVHITSCEGCRQVLRDIEADLALLAGLPSSALSESVADGAPPAKPEVPGYEIGAEVHRGGQGVVFSATQVATGRRVALKIMRDGPLATAAQRHRFEREVALVGSLRHPNVVTVYDGGTAAGGWQFIAMEFVEGERIDEWVAAHAPSRLEILRVFRGVVSGVAHAHQRGIMHRDLKPSNILVDAAGEPRVLDFGLARPETLGSDGGFHTESGVFVGTLAFAAPEQVRGPASELDVRSDVYALGLVLFRLLTGQHPYPLAADVPGMIHSITEVQPALVSSLAPGVPKDLDAVVGRALAKDRERRYPSALDLEREIDRLLRGDPVEARGDDLWYRTARFARRHWVALLIVSVFAATLVVATLVSVRFWSDEVRERKDAEKARVSATLSADRATRISEYMKRTLAFASPWGGGIDARLSDSLIPLSDELERTPPADPEVEAALRAALGGALSDVGLGARSEHHLRRAIELLTTLVGPLARETLAAKSRLASAMFHAARPEAAIDAIYSEIRDALPAVFGEAHDETFRMRFDELEHIADRGNLSKRRAKIPKARALVELCARLRPEDQRLGLIARRLLGQLLVHCEGENTIEGEALLRETIDAQRREFGPEHAETVVTSILHTGALLALNRNKEAEQDAIDVEPVAARVLGRRNRYALELSGMRGIALYGQRRFAEAVDALRPACEATRHSEPPLDWALAEFAGIQGTALHVLGRYAEALPLLRERCECFRRVGQAHDPYVIEATKQYALTLEKCGSLQEACDLMWGALMTQREIHAPLTHPWYQNTLVNVVPMLRDVGRWEDEESVLRELLTIELDPTLAQKWTVPKIRWYLADCLKRRGRIEEAVALYRGALPDLVERCGPQHPDVIELSLQFAAGLVIAQRWDEVLASLRDFEESLPGIPSTASPVGMRIEELRAEVTMAQGHTAEGEAVLRRIAAVDLSKGGSAMAVGGAARALAAFYSAQGRDADAAPFRRIAESRGAYGPVSRPSSQPSSRPARGG